MSLPSNEITVASVTSLLPNEYIVSSMTSPSSNENIVASVTSLLKDDLAKRLGKRVVAHTGALYVGEGGGYEDNSTVNEQ